MRPSRIVIAALSILFCIMLASTTGNAQQQQPIANSAQPPQQRQPPQRIEIALDSDGDGRPDDADHDGKPDHFIDSLFSCASRCGAWVEGAVQCASLGPVVYFCAAYAAYKCVKDCNDAFQ